MEIVSTGLAREIREASIGCFSMLRSKYPSEEICGYALYSDADATSVSPAINSRSHLEAMQANDPDDQVYYRWSPGEWAHELEGAEFFSEISRSLLEQARDLTSQAEIIEFRESVYEACVSSLEALVNEGMFSEGETDGVVVFTISDTEVPDIEIEWIARLNGEEKAKEFEDWVTSRRSRE